VKDKLTLAGAGLFTLRPEIDAEVSKTLPRFMLDASALPHVEGSAGASCRLRSISPSPSEAATMSRSLSSRRPTKRRRCSITQLAFHGIYTSRVKSAGV
jgi:hypothetical protein